MKVGVKIEIDGKDKDRDEGNVGEKSREGRGTCTGEVKIDQLRK